MLRNTKPYYPPPISLRDLAESVGLPVLRTIVQQLPGAKAGSPKRNEIWRFAVGDCVVMGYSSSVVIGGIDAVQMRQLAARIRLATQPTGNHTDEIRQAVDAALVFIAHQIGQRWRGEIDSNALVDLLTRWASLDPIVEALAYQEMASRFTDLATQKWYANTLQALVCAYKLGITAGLDVREDSLFVDA